MKNVITAIGNEYLNKKLRTLDNIIVKERDIFYKEGIIEYLEENYDLDIVVFNESLCEKNDLLGFLQTLNSFDISIFLIIQNDRFYGLQDFENLKNIKVFFSEEDVLLEFEENTGIIKESKLTDWNKKTRVISVLGNFGVGKTCFSSLIGNYLSRKYKVLIIDFDILNNSLKTLFNVKNKINFKNLNSLICKVRNNLDLLTDIKYYFNENNRIDIYKVKMMLEELKQIYEYIIIDTSSETKMKYVKTIFPSSDFNIFLVESNIIEVKKAKDILEVYAMDFDLDLNKSGLIINKNNINSIDENIVKTIFSEIKFLGVLTYSNEFNNYVNTYTKTNIKIKELNKIIKRSNING